MPDDLVAQAINELQERTTNIRCSELVAMLESLGFTVRKGANGGHRVFIHNSLDGFYSSSFDGGHGRDDTVKPVYVRSVRRILLEHETDLRALLEE